ncbi:T9SS type A sorting domain-containing protein [Dysgonomonas sp. ZJ279]|uniref:T9SS type A sorting domain-containing protein n=1 Tax=Dysgonomonas sp. ZJ279 TaxID=2709796 RepID=UPI0013EDBCA7|nr:T9SS type A sorting domain-containing protein [Dysgonomonas sp. ZJ279]
MSLMVFFVLIAIPCEAQMDEPYLHGPSALSHNEIGVFTFDQDIGYTSVIRWEVTDEDLEIISRGATQLTVRAKSPFFLNKYTTVKAHFLKQEGTDREYDSRSFTLTLVSMLPQITAFDEYDYPFYPGEIHRLYLPKLPERTTIKWINGENMELKFGQGTTEAGFLKYGNSYGEASAILNYYGHEFIIKFSEAIGNRPPFDICYKSIPKDLGITCYPKIKSCQSSVVLGDRIVYYIDDFPSDAVIIWEEVLNAVEPTYNDGAGVGLYHHQYASHTAIREGRAMVNASVYYNNKNYYLSNTEVVVNPPKKNAIEDEITNFNSDKQIINLRVYSLQGNIVYTTKDTRNFNINSTSLQNGIYIVETIDQDGDLSRTKVMKNED